MEQHGEEIEPFSEWLLARRPHHVIEIGVRHGGTAERWHEIATGLVIGVDWVGQWSLGEEDTLAKARQMEADLPRYRFVLGDSHSVETRQRVVSALNGEQVDFLFLDGDHTMAGITADWAMYTPLVKHGGCVAMHDIVDTEITRGAGQGVARFWSYFPESRRREFCINGPWGGIGVVEL